MIAVKFVLSNNCDKLLKIFLTSLSTLVIAWPFQISQVGLKSLLVLYILQVFSLYTTTTTFIYTKKEVKKNTLIFKLTNMVLVTYNNHTAKNIKQLSIGYNHDLTQENMHRWKRMDHERLVNGFSSHLYLLLTKFEGRTVSYRPILFLINLRAKHISNHILKAEKQGSKTYSKDWDDKATNIFIISLLCVSDEFAND